MESIREEFQDATHHCWAFVAGPPGSSVRIGLSDAGEPHGTAGRPILNTLLHSGMGEIVAVVTRYFGGVKLGKGGLSRAYSGSVTAALEALEVKARVSWVAVRVVVPFSSVDALFRLLDELGDTDRHDQYGSDVEVITKIPKDALSRVRSGVARFTSGRGRVEEAP